jgi:hypothetical protein
LGRTDPDHGHAHGHGTTGSERNDIVRGESDPTFTDLFTAFTYARGLLNDGPGGNDTATDIAAVQLNGDTMLFYSSTGTDNIDSAIRLVGIRVTDVTEASLGITAQTGGVVTPTDPNAPPPQGF